MRAGGPHCANFAAGVPGFRVTALSNHMNELESKIASYNRIWVCFAATYMCVCV